MSAKPLQVGFLLIGGVHQIYHTAPVAAALSSAYPDAKVVVIAADERSINLAKRVTQFEPASHVEFALLDRSFIGDFVGSVSSWQSASKLPMLWRNRLRLNDFDAVVVPECTSTIIRKMGVRHPKLICIPHGAGDRAVSFESRFRRFDRVLVAGEKTARRMIASGVSAERLSIVGYPKADLIGRMATVAPRLFANDRPVVLYNPHFRRSLSSLGVARALVEAFATQDRFNLVLAPHIRSFENASAAEHATWKALAVPDKVLVDLDSDHLVDMTYVAAADIYIGDVSSQVYEFLLSPRPCVFINAHGVDWVGNEDYAFWTLGDVVAPADVLGAVGVAAEHHKSFLPLQRRAVAATFGETGEASNCAARAIMGFLSGGQEAPPLQ